jgi:cyclin-dependent kinase-like
MHSINIIHRDVKPENVLISKQGSVKICDLGFARTMPSNRVMTDYVATRWYRPPELLIGKDDYDKSIDVWSIGCVMAEMIDGEPLFPGENDLDQLYLIQKCLGPLIAQHHEHFLKNPKFIGMKFPDIHNVETIDRRYFGKIDKHGLDLLKKMLRMDPKQRITPEEALNHTYFHRGVQFTET